MPRTRKSLTSAKSETSETPGVWLTHRCGAKWRGPSRAHCGACHRTFGGVTGFDKHRKNGVCLNPTTIGLVLSTAWDYEIWTLPVDEDTEQEWKEMKNVHDQPVLF